MPARITPQGQGHPDGEQTPPLPARRPGPVRVRWARTPPPKGDLGNWIFDGNCRGRDPREFAEEIIVRRRTICNKRIIAAMLVCQSCPVIATCSTFGHENKESGIYGGEYLHKGVTHDLALKVA